MRKFNNDVSQIKDIAFHLKHSGKKGTPQQPIQVDLDDSKQNPILQQSELSRQPNDIDEQMNSTIKAKKPSLSSHKKQPVSYSQEMNKKVAKTNFYRSGSKQVQPSVNQESKQFYNPSSNEKGYTSRQKKQRKQSKDQVALNKELTYESERSSVFNENISVKDSKNRSNIHKHYSKRPEEQKQQRVFDMNCNHHIDSEEGGTQNYVEKIKSFLEYNQRLSNLTSLSDKLFLKNQFLRSVDVRNNQIKTIPESLCNLTILWKLRIDNNLIDQLPNQIGKLEKLEVFTASNNLIKEIPQSLYKLKEKLSILQLNDNKIKKIHREIGQLYKLKILLLHNNFFSQIPHQLSQLDNLQEFSLEWFMYRNPPTNKILKGDKGLHIIKDFQKFCELFETIQPNAQCSFTSYISYSHKLTDIDQIPSLSMNVKDRIIIHYICLNGHLHLLKHLIRWCSIVDINYQDADGTTPVVLAFKNKQDDLIKYLMKHAATNFNKISSKYGFPLHIAIKNHQFRLALRLLRPKYVVNINAKDEDGSNALHYLMAHFSADPERSTKLLNLVLKKGIEVNLLNKAQLSPLHIAVKGFQNKALKYAVQYNQFIKNQNSNTQKNQKDLLAQTLNSLRRGGQQAFDFNITGKNLWTPLHFAVFNNNLFSVEVLLAIQRVEKVNFFCRDCEGRLPNDMCPFNSPIFKMITKRQKLLIEEKYKKDEKRKVKEEEDLLKHGNINMFHRNKTKQQIRPVHKKQVRSDQKGKVSSFKMNQRFDSNLFFFNAEESNSDSNEEFEQRLISTQKVRSSERIVDLDFGEQRKKSKLEEFKVNAAMTNSKTEKNILTVNFKNAQSKTFQVPQNNSQLSDLDQRRFIACATKPGKQSPRILMNAAPLPPKQMMNSEEGNLEKMILSDTESDQEIDNLQFMSNNVNFCTEQLNDTDEEKEDENSSSFGMEHSRSESSFEYPSNLQKIDIRGSQRKEKGNSSFRIIYKEEKEQIQKSQLVLENDEEDDDEFCCAAEEDIETGAIGLMTNKINKFDNHNAHQVVEDQYLTLGQRACLEKIVQQLMESRFRKRQAKSIKYKLIDSQRLGNQRYRDQSEIETPVNQRIFEIGSDEMVDQRDDGNVFDTVDNIDDMIPQFIPDQLQQNIQTKDNIFLKDSRQTDRFSNPYGQNSREEIGINLGGLGQLRKLNRDCQLYDTCASFKSGNEINYEVFNEGGLSLAQKYMLMYRIIYQKGTNQLNGNVIRTLYDKIDDTRIYNNILKADLAYLMSVGKNKEHIPLLDKVMSKIKQKEDPKPPTQEQTKNQKERPNNQSKTSVQSFISKKKTSQTHMLYEASNAYQQLMYDVMLQSRKIMEQNNNQIKQERERSKERLKFRHQTHMGSYTQRSYHQNDSSFTSSSNNYTGISIYNPNTRLFGKRKDSDIPPSKSIRQAPELVARLNKSPSTQTIQKPNVTTQRNQKSQKNYSQLNIQTTEILPMKNLQIKEISQKQSEEMVASKEQEPISLTNTITQVLSFTPKGSSGQVFLAFQKQKQQVESEECHILHKDEIMKLNTSNPKERSKETNLKSSLVEPPKQRSRLKERVLDQKNKVFEEESFGNTKQPNNHLKDYLQKRKDELIHKTSFHNKNERQSSYATNNLNQKKNYVPKPAELYGNQYSQRMKLKGNLKQEKKVMRHHSPLPQFDYSIDKYEEMETKGGKKQNSNQKVMKGKPVKKNVDNSKSSGASQNQSKGGNTKQMGSQRNSGSQMLMMKKSTSTSNFGGESIFHNVNI